MTSNPSNNRRALILVPIVVLIVVGAFMFVGYALTLLFRIPVVLGLSLPIRLAGAALLVMAVALWVWLFQHRSPVDVLTSTYLTF